MIILYVLDTNRPNVRLLLSFRHMDICKTSELNHLSIMLEDSWSTLPLNQKKQLAEKAVWHSHRTMSKEKLDSLVKTMEAMLSEVEQLKVHCTKQTEEVNQLVQDIRRENKDLAEKYAQITQDMQEAREAIGQLQDTKFAFEAKERQAQKLSRQL
ncbi:uncharacterized protein LOC143774288 [Ranitomeya variabilis]|uniref:uncharacterized protein LOC143774288 n=1 Tax=Ranitomeya variabilis TaxID=490064 RepID=UPI004056E7AE